MAEGIITKALSGFYYVDTGSGTVTCRARGRFRHANIRPLVGDRVTITLTSDGGMVDEIHPRKNEFSRPPVANIDQMVLVVSRAVPVADTFLMDRMIAVAEHYGADTVICVNKNDLESGRELYDVYTHAGFRAVLTSAQTGEGIDELRQLLKGKVSAFAGNSGVGKSSILNAIDPALSISTGQISQKLGRGRHTTRHVELFSVNGAMIADTPGFSMFDTDDMGFAPEEIQHLFREFAPYLGKCAYNDCAHVAERGCAVLDALRAGDIERSRHESYVGLYRQAKAHNQWELKK